MNTPYIIVLVTAKDKKEAEKIAAAYWKPN